jgi:hypothetical protein
MDDETPARSGVGVSVNRILRNVSWVATPGRDLFFHGELAETDTLDDATYERAIRSAASARHFSGIAIDAAVMRSRPVTMPVEELVVRNSIGTDFALTFARHVYSARLPLPRQAMTRLVAFLNDVNERAQKSGYTWNAYTNNCSHVIHNALAAAGIWDAKIARPPGIASMGIDVVSVAHALVTGRMSDFSFPANNFVRAYEAGNRRPIDDVTRAYRDHDVRRTLDDGWLSTGPGALITRYPMHDAGRNRLFDPGRDPFLFSVPALWDKRRDFEKLTREPPDELSDLRTNLVRFRERYAGALDGRPTVNDALTRLGAKTDPRAFGLFHERFFAHLERELARTDARIAEHDRLAVAETRIPAPPLAR